MDYKNNFLIKTIGTKLNQIHISGYQIETKRYIYGLNWNQHNGIW